MAETDRRERSPIPIPIPAHGPPPSPQPVPPPNAHEFASRRAGADGRTAERRPAPGPGASPCRGLLRPGGSGAGTSVGARRRERDPSLPPRPSGPRDRAVRAPLPGGRPLAGLQAERTPQYLVIGHIAADVQADGSAVLGGTALYSALTAARLGWRVGVLTRGAFGRTVDGIAVPGLDEFADEISIVAQEAESPTFFVNEYAAGRRVQTIRRWAGPIDLRGLPPHWRNARVVHLGPIAQEIDLRQVGALTPEFFGATPQGWMREWPLASGGRVTLSQLRLPAELLARLDAVVVSDEEVHLARDVLDRVGARRLGVITLGEQGARIVYGGERADLPGFPVKTVDLTGAGDVFAAAFFIRASDRAASALDAGRFANAVAALSLRGVGPASVPTRREVETLLAAARDRADAEQPRRR